MSETMETNLAPTTFEPLVDDDDDTVEITSLPPEHGPARPRRRTWLIALVVVLLLALVGGGTFFYMQHSSQAPVQYTQQAATIGNLTLTVSATGSISPNATYAMNFTVSGQVSEIDVHVGQQVKRGQVLAKLSSPNLQDAVTQAQQAVNNAQTAYNDAVANGVSQTSLDNLSGQLQSAQDQLKTAQDNLAGMVMTAPANATVAAITGVNGQSASVGGSSSTTPFMTLVDTSSFIINALVNEADIAKVQVGQSARFTVEAYPSQTFRATVSTVETIGQSSSNVVAYPVSLIVVAQRLGSAHLYTGMTATVTITTVQRTGALLISNAALNFPVTALQAGVISRSALVPTRGSGSFGGGSSAGASQRVVLELRNGVLTPVFITIGLTNGTFTEVLSGLNAGDQVVAGATGGKFNTLSTSSSGSGFSTGTGGGFRGGGGGNSPIRIQGGGGG